MVRSALDALNQVDLMELTAPELSAFQEAQEVARRKLAAQQNRTLDLMDRTGFHRRDGHFSAKAMVRHQGRLSNGEALRRSQVMQAMRDMGIIAAAFLEGSIGVASARFAVQSQMPRASSSTLAKPDSLPVAPEPPFSSRTPTASGPAARYQPRDVRPITSPSTPGAAEPAPATGRHSVAGTTDGNRKASVSTEAPMASGISCAPTAPKSSSTTLHVRPSTHLTNLAGWVRRAPPALCTGVQGVWFQPWQSRRGNKSEPASGMRNPATARLRTPTPSRRGALPIKCANDMVNERSRPTSARTAASGISADGPGSGADRSR